MAFEDEKYAIKHNQRLWDNIITLNEYYEQRYAFSSVYYEEKEYTKKTTYAKVFARRGEMFDYESFIIAKMVEEIDYYDSIINNKELLRKYEAYQKYEEQIKQYFKKNRLCQSADDCLNYYRGFLSRIFSDKYDRYTQLLWYEDDIFSTTRLNIKFPSIRVVLVSQTSSREYGEIRKNTYKSSKTFTLSDIIKYYQQAKEKRGKMSFVEQQRATMSDKLRYTVLCRDKFKCQLCGSSQQDGVKLEVDHIVPVSKGGRTELDNLQTLCERCNRGKRDEMPANIPVYTRPAQVVSTPMPKSTIPQKRVEISHPMYSPPAKVNYSSAKMTKAEAKQLCIRNNIPIDSIITFASSNDSASRKYWANPNISVLNKDWTLILNDKINKRLHIFKIPAGDIEEGQLKTRSDNDGLIDLQIYYNDKNFQDSRSDCAFAPWYIQTISY